MRTHGRQPTAGASLPPISDEFIPALRAEAGGDPAAAAALPLVTAAANIGELELTYSAATPSRPHLTETPSAQHRLRRRPRLRRAGGGQHRLGGVAALLQGHRGQLGAAPG